jgi:hypothetical protein
MSDSKAFGLSWKSPLHVWLKSEYLDETNFARFGIHPAAFESPSWPLGLRVNSDGSGGTASEVVTEIIDAGFDYDVNCAWQLPLRYSRLSLGARRGIGPRADLNWLIRGAGYWRADRERYCQVLCLFNEDDRGLWRKYRAIKSGYALTPFCAITQRWTEESEDNSRGELLFCDIAFFYTFETFIQECLALDACRRGVDPVGIASRYEHSYSNLRPRPELILSNPDEFALSRLAEAPIDWRSILDLRRDASDVGLVQSARLNLFKARRQCHLMVAIAAACIGIPALASQESPSRIVQTAETPFAFDSLAPHWLKHVTGGLDYASECESLLTALAAQYGNALYVNRRGVPEPLPWLASTQAEEVVARETPPILLSRGEPEGYGRYRWALFDTSLDDQSIRDWQSRLET